MTDPQKTELQMAIERARKSIMIGYADRPSERIVNFQDLEIICQAAERVVELEGSIKVKAWALDKEREDTASLRLRLDQQGVVVERLVKQLRSRKATLLPPSSGYAVADEALRIIGECDRGMR